MRLTLGAAETKLFTKTMRFLGRTTDEIIMEAAQDHIKFKGIDLTETMVAHLLFKKDFFKSFEFTQDQISQDSDDQISQDKVQNFQISAKIFLGVFKPMLDIEECVLEFMNSDQAETIQVELYTEDDAVHIDEIGFQEISEILPPEVDLSRNDLNEVSFKPSEILEYIKHFSGRKDDIEMSFTASGVNVRNLREIEDNTNMANMFKFKSNIKSSFFKSYMLNADTVFAIEAEYFFDSLQFLMSLGECVVQFYFKGARHEVTMTAKFKSFEVIMVQQTLDPDDVQVRRRRPGNRRAQVSLFPASKTQNKNKSKLTKNKSTGRATGKQQNNRTQFNAATSSRIANAPCTSVDVTMDDVSNTLHKRGPEDDQSDHTAQHKKCPTFDLSQASQTLNQKEMLELMEISAMEFSDEEDLQQKSAVNVRDEISSIPVSETDSRAADLQPKSRFQFKPPVTSSRFESETSISSAHVTTKGEENNLHETWSNPETEDSDNDFEPRTQAKKCLIFDFNQASQTLNEKEIRELTEISAMEFSDEEDGIENNQRTQYHLATQNELLQSQAKVNHSKSAFNNISVLSGKEFQTQSDSQNSHSYMNLSKVHCKQREILVEKNKAPVKMKTIVASGESRFHHFSILFDRRPPGFNASNPNILVDGSDEDDD